MTQEEKKTINSDFIEVAKQTGDLAWKLWSIYKHESSIGGNFEYALDERYYAGQEERQGNDGDFFTYEDGPHANLLKESFSLKYYMAENPLPELAEIPLPLIAASLIYKYIELGNKPENQAERETYTKHLLTLQEIVTNPKYTRTRETLCVGTTQGEYGYNEFMAGLKEAPYMQYQREKTYIVFKPKLSVKKKFRTIEETLRSLFNDLCLEDIKEEKNYIYRPVKGDNNSISDIDIEGDLD